MKTEKQTSMELRNISGGIKLNVDGRFATSSFANNLSALAGYDIQTRTSGKLEYRTLTLTTEDDVDDPASLMLSVDYNQIVAFDEVDLDVEYKNIPDGTFLEVNSSDSVFSLSRQAIDGSSIVGKQGIDVGSLEMSIGMSLWFAKPEELNNTSTVTLSMSKIEGTGGPVKKTVLEKIVINLTDDK